MRQSRLNLITTAGGFLLSMVIGIWFTPFLVHRLGPAGYGLIPLATTIVSYFSVVSQTLSASLNRNLTFALESGDADRVQVAFGSALFGSLLLFVILGIPLGLLSIFSTEAFNVPAGAETQTRILFAFVAVAFLISVVSTPFQALTFSRNRIDLSNIGQMAQTIVRVGLTVLLFAALSATVLYAATGILVAAIVGFALNLIFARRVVPGLRVFDFRYDPSEVRSISGIASKGLIMQVGTILTMSSELVLINLLFGEHDGGRYAAVMQWVLLLRNSATAIAVLCVPTILALYARDEPEELVRYTRTAMKLMAICVALPAGYLCGLAPQILGVWLGPDFVALWPLMLVQITPLVIVSTVVPLYTVSLAANRILVPALVQLATGALGVMVALALGANGVFGMFGIAAAVGWTFALKELAFTPAYVAGNVHRPRGIFLSPFATAILLFASAGGMAAAIGHAVEFHSLFQLGLAGLPITLVYCAIAYLLLDHTERAAIRAFLPGKAAAPA